MACAGGDWGICGVTQRSARGRRRSSRPRTGCTRSPMRGGHGRGAARRRRGAGAAVGPWPTSTRVLERMAATRRRRSITLTVTEKGYHRDPASDRLRLDSPEIAADLAGRPPAHRDRTAGRRPGAAPAPAMERRSPSCAATTCPRTARVVRALVGEFAARRDDGDGLAAWIAEQVRFPCTMVDRIVPATTDADLADTRGAARRRAIRGPWSPSRSASGSSRTTSPPARPAWERAGALLTADVAPLRADQAADAQRQPLDDRLPGCAGRPSPSSRTP